MKNQNNKHKKVVKNQNYENYWKLTLEYSDIHGFGFLTTLKYIIDFIDSRAVLDYKKDLNEYVILQNDLFKMFKKADKASTRKSINQMIKLGFVKPFLSGYHKKTKAFLQHSDKEKRELIFSEIYYSSASFQSSVKKDKTEIKEINFFVKTLMYKNNQSLNKDEIISIISSDLTSFSKGYMTENEIKAKIQHNEFNNFKLRKYNQIRYFINFLKFIPGLTYDKDNSKVSYLKDSLIFTPKSILLKRDQTLHRIMTEELKLESKKVYNGKIVCYLSKKEQKGMVNSHIIPFSVCIKNNKINDAYNYKNALLLTPDIDQYFDKFNLSINENGLPIFDKTVPKHLIEELSNKSLDNEILKERLIFLKYHRNFFNSKIDSKN